jgi:hypothetical protein
MRTLLEIGYKGYVGHKFIPTRDPLAGLRQAVQVCDVSTLKRAPLTPRSRSPALPRPRFPRRFLIRSEP